MYSFIIKRAAYSVLILLGVVIVTFVLFKVAAGDPAAAVLGKNPSPAELENMRAELGSDKPLFWGHWKKTVIYPSAKFGGNRDIPGIIIKGRHIFTDSSIKLNEGEMEFRRNFPSPGETVRAEIEFSGGISIKGGKYYSDSKSYLNYEFKNPREKVILSALSPDTKIFSVSFYRKQKKPYNSQFFSSLGEIISFKKEFPYFSFFNFGKTLVTREPVSRVLRRGIVPSLCLMIPIFLGELILGITLALLSTAFKGSLIDKITVILSVAGMSVSYLVFIIFGQWFLGYRFNLFPVWGWGGIKFLALPVIVGILSGLGGGVRFYRTVFINELNKEYLRTAKAKGCSSFKIYTKHLLRNAMVPILTRASTVFPFLFTGSLLLESFFGIPGLGYAGINALRNSDLQMLKALVIMGAFLFVFINLLTDLAYAWVDPRVRVNK